VTKPKYATETERKAALSAHATAQMRDQWERKREESGQELGYFGCHRRVRRARGRAKDQTCECGAQGWHWAHIHDTDPTDVQNYRAMCQKCHWAYDGVGRKMVEAKTPEERSAAAVLAWSRRTPEDVAAIGSKISATRRRNREPQNVVAPDPALARDPHRNR
jgi:hypothetical protein